MAPSAWCVLALAIPFFDITEEQATSKLLVVCLAAAVCLQALSCAAVDPVLTWRVLATDHQSCA
jgi:hypothetical protein